MLRFVAISLLKSESVQFISQQILLSFNLTFINYREQENEFREQYQDADDENQLNNPSLVNDNSLIILGM